MHQSQSLELKLSVRPPPVFPQVPAPPAPPAATPAEDRSGVAGRISTAGKFFRLYGSKWFLKGFTYGPFAPNRLDAFLPEPPQMRRDFAHMRQLGATAIRLYHHPSREVLDEAIDHGLRVFIDVPWEKHRCFFEDWSAQMEAVRRVRETARELGRHPAVFAISVANEIPKDIVRFYGPARVERFIGELLQTVKQEAPECLATYTNYPSTEFLALRHLDFYSANVYLEDPAALGRYLERLQHIAGPLPLVLGEYGLDSLRHGEAHQAAVLERHVGEVFGHGVAGSFIFAYTDDWFTGGQQIEDWAFGVTDRHRNEKPAARAVRQSWSRVPPCSPEALPRVSVVVCSYNGAATLEECLRALTALDYPDYEVILVDDGSTDHTPGIAAHFPSIRYIRQANAGLSVARNVGARAATGEIVAYTDSDCVPDETWLLYLIQAMRDQQVEAIGGPNVVPPSDGWVARCVAASPGGPSHVMLDDRRAEHIPGCNMAFRRDRLLALGGFDPQFTQAGDDVDICWRFLGAGFEIGYAPAALVWHHRRSTVRAYCRQQTGYGRAEAMLQFKHPNRFNAVGCSRWRGIIYGEGAIGLPLLAPVVYHGRFGSGLFQMVYRRNDYSLWAYVTLLEWHVSALLIGFLSIAVPPLAVIAGAMIAFSLVAASRAAIRAELPPGGPWWCRPVVAALHLIQPAVRSWARYGYRLRNKRVPAVEAPSRRISSCTKRISVRDHDLYFESRAGRGREHLLDALVEEARRVNWHGNFDAEWASHDVELVGGFWHKIRLRTASEELGSGHRFTRVRCSILPTRTATLLIGGLCLMTLAAAGGLPGWALPPLLAAWLPIPVLIVRGRNRCRRAISRLVWQAAGKAHLLPVAISVPAAAIRDQEAPAEDSLAGGFA